MFLYDANRWNNGWGDAYFGVKPRIINSDGSTYSADSYIGAGGMAGVAANQIIADEWDCAEAVSCSGSAESNTRNASMTITLSKSGYYMNRTNISYFSAGDTISQSYGMDAPYGYILYMGEINPFE